MFHSVVEMGSAGLKWSKYFSVKCENSRRIKPNPIILGNLEIQSPYRFNLYSQFSWFMAFKNLNEDFHYTQSLYEKLMEKFFVAEKWVGSNALQLKKKKHARIHTTKNLTV